MGSRGSKTCRGSSSAVVGEMEAAAASASASGSGGRRSRRSRRHWSLPSSCLSSSSTSHHSDDDEQVSSQRHEEDTDCYEDLEEKKTESRNSHDIELELDDCGEASVSNVPMRNSSSGRESSVRSLSTRGRIFSHFRFISGNISSRSMNCYRISSSPRTTSNHLEAVTSPSESRQENHMHPTDDFQHESRVEEGANMCPPRQANDGVMELSEQNVQFSRTLSVGRLRDRVLRRPLHHQGEDANAAWLGHGLILGNQTTTTTTTTAENNTLTSSATVSNRRSMIGLHDHDMETPHARDGRYQDLLEHRANFLERRRRIRSQVRSLQTMGGHDRSCPLAGQSQEGHCTCNGEGNHGSSISRIVMLAEALFEVLDEIHQQSVVLTSQQSVSSIGSVPAPHDVVDLLPMKLYTKSHKHGNEEASQCYICLLEYEEGDIIRTLPCHHAFHRTCVDKWLKEIHRVCPLCRGDICRSDPSLEPRL